MNRLLIACCCLFVAQGAYAYDEHCMPGLAVPTQIDEQNLEASIAHRFSRTPGPDFPDNFIQFANVRLGLRYVVLPRLEVGTSYQFFQKEYTFHGAYSLFLPDLFLRTQALVQFFGAKHDIDNGWDHNLLYQLNLQSEPLAGRLLPAVNLVFDGLSQKAGLGTGLDVVVTDNVDLVGEYYPVLGKRDTLFDGKQVVNCFQAGVRFTTAGHHFTLTIGNTYEIGIRRLMAGTASNTIYYGFNIERLFSL